MRGSFTFLLALLLPIYTAGQEPKQPRVVKKKNQEKEPVNQTLPLLKDPPAAISAETSRLVFHVSPLSDKGLLSQQIRDALKAMMQTNHNATIVKLRAFVAGRGDMRRVQSIVSEVFTDKKLPLPVLSIVQVGALDLEGAQVVIESASTQEKGEKRAANPNGLAFFSGQLADNGPNAVGRLEAEAKTARVTPEDMLRVTCFLSSIEESKAARAAAARAFPGAVANFVQTLRLGSEQAAVCEAVGRRSQPSGQIEFSVSNPSTFVIVNTPKLVFSGIQMAFLDQDADLRLAFERLRKVIEPVGAGYKDVIFLNIYPLTRAVEQKFQALQSQLIPPEIHPAGTTLLFEGLPSLDATVGVEVVAAVRN
jgi:enamine deaminase RidA (YjgF/YER057c/UK114 family)